MKKLRILLIAAIAVAGLPSPEPGGAGATGVINGMGHALAKATIEFYKANGGITGSGPLATQLPGAPAGAVLAVERFGMMPLSEIWAPVNRSGRKRLPGLRPLREQHRARRR